MSGDRPPTTDALQSSQRASNQAPSQTTTEWSARVRCRQCELGGSFSVLLFLGEIPPAPETPDEWFLSPNFAGSFDVFGGDEPEEPDQRDDETEGTVYLNRTILKLSDQRSLDPRVVLPLLRGTLQPNWLVLKVGSGVAELQSLEVVVLSTPLTLPIGKSTPVPGRPTYHYDITYGRPGGSRRP
ncbi:hypothetical protein AX16_002862 [Volvariella volvacea WC 439]|nr:hypothetical protein AX16_002862 [Volvariella volvacea WC 439]